MVDNREPPRNTPDTDYQATLREWARKHYLRDHMREDALPADEFKLLDERLARWTADQQHIGRLPPDYALQVKSATLEREFRNNRDEARPIFTMEEQRDVDASRAACSLRDRIDGQEDLGASLRQVSVQYAIANALGEFDARKRVSDRFGELYARSVSDYAKEQRRERPREPKSQEMRVLPPELGWDRYDLPSDAGLRTIPCSTSRNATARSARKNMPNGRTISGAGLTISSGKASYRRKTRSAGITSMCTS